MTVLIYSRDSCGSYLFIREGRSQDLEFSPQGVVEGEAMASFTRRLLLPPWPAPSLLGAAATRGEGIRGRPPFRAFHPVTSVTTICWLVQASQSIQDSSLPASAHCQ